MARSSKSSKGSTKQPDTAEDTAGEETETQAGAADTEPEKTESLQTDEAASDADEAVLIVEEEAPDDTREDGATEVSTDTAPPSEVPGVIPASVESAAPPPPPAPTPPPSSGPSTFGLVFGGLVAGAIGFLVATFAVPEGWPNPQPTGTGDLEAAIADQSAQLEALSGEIDALRSAPPATAETQDTGPLLDRIAEIEAQSDGVSTQISDGLAALDSRIAELEARLSDLESRPAAAAGIDGSAAMEARLEEFRQQLDTVTADAEARIAEAQERATRIEAEAAAAAQAAERAAALASVKAALDSGSPFSDALAVLPDAPEALSAVAADGVTTLGDLQAAFPEAARTALAQARTVPEDASAGERVAAFLKRRTNARSLTPREGDDADAVLSRAEAALKDGDLAGALAELQALPDPARDAMSDWISTAETRSAAVDALTALETENNQG